jgi:hypothetical protein
MLGVSREAIEHTLNIKPGSKSVKQGLHCFNEEKHKAIGKEFLKFLTTGFVKEVQHSDWIANLVLVPKKNGKWRMCVDYMSLNKERLKDLFPLPRIDQVVDPTHGCELLSFLDVYSSYHQISLTEADQSATTFTTPFGYFCYIKMSFRLKNAGATYQRCMQFCFKEQIGHNLEVYINDIMIKSRKSCSLISDLEETFNYLRRFNIKLNPKNAPSESLGGSSWGTSLLNAALK